MSARRHEIVDYLVAKYGKARVAGASDFRTLAAASAIRGVGRVLGMSTRDYAVFKVIAKKHGASVSASEFWVAVPKNNKFTVLTAKGSKAQISN